MKVHAHLSALLSPESGPATLSSISNTEVFQLIFWGSLLVATLWVGFCACTCLTNEERTGRMGMPMWDFSQSWASTITGVGVIIALILSYQLVPAKTRMLPRESFAILAMLFGSLMVIAPFFYSCIRKAEEVRPDPSRPEIKEYQFQGYVRAFLVSCAISLSAALGQLATVCVLFLEMQFAALIPGPIALLFEILFGAIAVLLLFYARTSITWTVRQQRQKQATGKFQLQSALSAKPTEAGAASASIPRWPIL